MGAEAVQEKLLIQDMELEAKQVMEVKEAVAVAVQIEALELEEQQEEMLQMLPQQARQQQTQAPLQGEAVAEQAARTPAVEVAVVHPAEESEETAVLELLS